ncbi:MAG: acetyl-CoA C-acetyltransferase [Thiotrichales bacterium]
MKTSYKRPIWIVDGARSPFLKAGAHPGPLTASDLAVQTGKALLRRQRVAADVLDEVILGCVNSGPDEANIARVSALRMGCDQRTPAWTVQRNCGSGMQALDSAAQSIASGRSELVLAGGTEAMSHAPMLFPNDLRHWLADFSQAKAVLRKIRLLSRLRPHNLRPVIGLLRGLRDPTVGLSMGETAEVLADKFGLRRQALDAYAVRSHLRLAAAYDKNLLQEIIPIFDRDGQVYERDEGLRPDSSMEKLARLKPVFDRTYGLVTAGNSSQITDGATWLLLASEKAVERHDLPVLAQIVDCHWAGNDPREMGLGPVYAATPIIMRNALALHQIEFWEINEAFAAQVLACCAAWADEEFCQAELGLDAALGELPQERLNVDGGAIAMGHPVGTSGARIVLHLAQVLNREGARHGIATQCIGGGQGGAMLLEVAS